MIIDTGDRIIMAHQDGLGFARITLSSVGGFTEMSVVLSADELIQLAGVAKSF